MNTYPLLDTISNPCDLRALERELSGLRLPDSALRQVCRRDEHHARELLRNPRTRYGQSQRNCP